MENRPKLLRSLFYPYYFVHITVTSANRHSHHDHKRDVVNKWSKHKHDDHNKKNHCLSPNAIIFKKNFRVFLQHKGEMEKEWLVVDGERPVEKAVVYGGRG